MTKFRFIILLSFLLFFVVTLIAKNGKKVYADFHGVRYTRLHDGKTGRWEMYAKTEKSVTPIKLICRNADNINENGQHEIAAAHYPIVGMQSNLDNDYIEYQILSAKIAGIDGFFVEWGFKPHENDVLLKAMQKIAAKYDFEIGVNWCDGWLYYDWITKLFPKIDTREKKTAYMIDCYQYLIDSVLTTSTAPKVNGYPVFYHFGGGANQSEFCKVLKSVHLKNGMQVPVILRRWADWGKLVNDKYQPVTYSEDIEKWKALGEIPTPWIPARVRKRDYTHNDCDFWASDSDMVDFLKPFRDSIWLSSNPSFMIKSGFVMPGMDNRGCGGWGHSVFYDIEREGGKTYSNMWNFCMQQKDSLDMMFIASWSDYTEGHEIEPSVENGDRELRTTLKYASEFKEFTPDYNALDLPLRLFRLRKNTEFLRNVGVNIKSVSTSLDNIALLISQMEYENARDLLTLCKTEIQNDMMQVKMSGKKLKTSDLYINGRFNNSAWDANESVTISLPLNASLKLNDFYNNGKIEFEYMDVENATLFVRSATNRAPKDYFSTVGKIRTTGSNVWKKARIELLGRNILYPYNKPAFYIKGNTKVRNISISLKTYSVIK